MRYLEKWGDSIDNAVSLALADLGLTRDQVEVTVLEQPTRGFFGIGSKLARVRVEEKAPEKEEQPEKPAKPEMAEKPASVQQRPQRPERKERRRPVAEIKTDGEQKIKVKREDGVEIVIEKCGVDSPQRLGKSSRSKKKKNRNSLNKQQNRRENEEYLFDEVKVLSERPKDLVEQSEHPAKSFLENVIKEMGLNLEMKVCANAESVYVDFEGEDSGTVIGKRGSMLDALQYLTSLVINKDSGKYTRVVLDAENYREKRERTLERLANHLANKVENSGRSVRLEPMNPYERKVIHTVLQSRPAVTTRSEGEEPYRRIIIELAK